MADPGSGSTVDAPQGESNPGLTSEPPTATATKPGASEGKSRAAAGKSGAAAGMFDRPKPLDGDASDAGAVAAAASPRSASAAKKVSSNLNSTVNPVLLWLLALALIGGVAFVVFTKLSGDDGTTSGSAEGAASPAAADGETAPSTLSNAALLETPLAVSIGDGQITISGIAANQATVDSVTKRAKSAIGAEFTINNTIAVAAGAKSIQVDSDPVLKMLADPILKGVSAQGVTITHAKPPAVLAVGGKVATPQARDRILGAASGAAGGVEKVDDKLKVDSTIGASNGSGSAAANAPAGVQVTLDKLFQGRVIEFASGSESLTAQWKTTVDELSAALQGNDTQLQIVGHTDNIGDAEINQALSQRRAESIKAAMVKKGIDAARISTTGFGADKPIASNDTADGRQRNRRIEFVIAAGS